MCRLPVTDYGGQSTLPRQSGIGYHAAVRRLVLRCSMSLVALWTMAGGGGCGDGKRPPDEESDFVDLYLEDGIEICGGQLDAYDRFLERIFEFYAGDDPGDIRIPMHVLEDPGCPGGQSCAEGGVVWLSQNFAQYHELVHVMQGSVDGESIPSLEEGTAEGLGPLIPIAYEAEYLADLDPDFLFASQAGDVDYPHAGAFTRFLIDRQGIDVFRQFFRSMGKIDEFDELKYRSEFDAAFGEDLDDAWTIFRSEPRCSYDFWYCDQRTLIELPFELNGIDCDAPEVIGYDGSALDLPPTKVPYMPTKIVHLDNDQPRTITVELEYASIYLGGCGDCSQQQPALILSSSDNPDFPPIQVDLAMQMGTAAFVVRARPGGTTRVSIVDAD